MARAVELAAAVTARLRELATIQVAEHRLVATALARMTVQHLLREARRRKKPPRT